MRRRRKMPPEEALQLQEEIESYLTGKDLAEHDDETLSRYEQRHDKALREHDAKFFDTVADLCRSTKGVFSAGDEGEVKRIAVLVRIWLEHDGHSVTGDVVRELTETVWAARLISYKPNGVFLATHQETLGFEGERPMTTHIEIWRAQGTWSEYDYINVLLTELAIQKNTDLCDRIDHARRSFPKSAWKRVWQDPALSDIKPRRGRPTH